jgi:hypothetical protein
MPPLLLRSVARCPQATAAGAVSRGGMAGVGVGDGLHDGKAQPGPAAVSGPGRLGAMEAFECGKNSAGKPGPRSATSIVIIPVPFALALTSTTLSAGACRVALSSRCPPLGVTAQTPCDAHVSNMRTEHIVRVIAGVRSAALGSRRNRKGDGEQLRPGQIEP